MHVAAAVSRIVTWRASMLYGGGGWVSQWGPVAAPDDSPSAIAVRGTTGCVVGKAMSAGGSGIDLAILAYTH